MVQRFSFARLSNQLIHSFAALALMLVCNLSVVAQESANLFGWFENPHQLTSENIRFPQTLTIGNRVMVLYEKISKQTEEGGSLMVVGRLTDSTGHLGEEFPVCSVPFSGSQAPLVFSAVTDGKSQVHVVYTVDALSSALLVAKIPAIVVNADQFKPVFTELGRIKTESTAVSPRLFLRPGGGFVVVLTQSSTISQNSFITQSVDGKTWTPPLGLDQELKGNINMNPFWASAGGRDYVVFQSLNFAQQTSGGVNYFQIYLKYSDDKGLTWSEPVQVTAFANADDRATTGWRSYDNQRPILAVDGEKVMLFWERSYKKDPRQIWLLRLKHDGSIQGLAAQVTNNPSGGFGPVYQKYDGHEYLSWFSTSSKGSRAWISILRDGDWTHRDMSQGYGGSALYPVFGFALGRIHYFYYARPESDTVNTRLVYVEPDQSATAPIIDGNFRDGERNRRNEIKFNLLPRADASGIVGYSVIINQNSDTPVPPVLQYRLNDTIPPVTLDKDGTWYVLARALDRAGNWSTIEHKSYILDNTPTDPVTFAPLPVDEKGYLRSNTFSIEWKPPVQSDVASYAWSLQYLGDISIDEALAKSVNFETLPVMGNQTTTRIGRQNVENGIYLLAVWAIDQVGNRSQSRFVYLFANKYIPSTKLSFVDVKQDILGDRYLIINGRGFTQNGTISRIVLDRDGLAPWDYEYLNEKSAFVVENDRLIDKLKMDNVRTGRYLLGVDHTERGFEFSGTRLDFQERGIIKFGDFTIEGTPGFTVVASKGITIETGTLILILIMILIVIIMVVSGFQLRSVFRESQLLERTAIALIEGRDTPIREAQRKVKDMKRRRIGLRIKFTAFFLILVVGVVLLISLPLSDFTLTKQKSILAQGLKDRLDVLIESLQSSATIYLQQPDSYGTELEQLTTQGSIMPEVNYITITAQGRDKSDNFDIVWASSDTRIITDKPELQASGINPILKRDRMAFIIDKSSQTAWSSGRSGIQDVLSPQLKQFEKDFDQKFRTGLGSLPADLKKYSQELKSLLLNTTKEGQAEFVMKDALRKKINDQLIAKQREMSGNVLSMPAYDFTAYNTAIQDYIFYKPIYFRVGDEVPETARYYRGLVRVGVSTAPINETIIRTQNEIVQRIIIAALVALGGGLIGAIILSSIIVGPIRRLVRGVEEIREIIGLDVESQERRFGDFLHAGSITLKSKDELATLSGSITEMVDGLKHAATANKDLVAGADIQKMFMPLDMVGDVKGTVGGRETPLTEIFGYYEGAKGVSGDFLNFEQISPNVWACIKCDISGKGIPAALIMVEVATIFLSYFEEWKRKEAERKKPGAAGKTAVKYDGILTPLVLTINDLVYERQFKGRFAAFNIVLYEEKTGACLFCHAGDKIVYILRDQTKKVETINLQSTPAAGMFSSKDEFPPFFRCREERNVLQVGDVLMFFTDGIDESRRKFRNPDFTPYLASDEDIANGLVPTEDEGTIGVPVPGSDKKVYEAEQFTWNRANAIAEAVRRRGSYRLEKFLNPIRDEELDFDFSGLQGTARDIVIALSAVEKMFRIIPDTHAGSDDRILVDKVVDDFLKLHFKQYNNYFRHERTEITHKLYRVYSHLKEEDQFDDLAYLAIRRKS